MSGMKESTLKTLKKIFITNVLITVVLNPFMVGGYIMAEKVDGITPVMMGLIPLIYSFAIHCLAGEEIWKGWAKGRGLVLYLIYGLIFGGMIKFTPWEWVGHIILVVTSAVPAGLDNLFLGMISILPVWIILFLLMVEIPSVLTYGSWELLQKIFPK